MARPSTIAFRFMPLGLAASLLLSACTASPSVAPGAVAPARTQLAPTSIETGTVTRDILSSTISVSGSVQARSQANLVPKISARIDKVHVEVGDEVEAGQVVAELDHALLDAQVQQAEAAVGVAQAKLEQAQAGAKPEDLEAARAAVDQAYAKLAQASAGGRPEEIAAARAQADQAYARAAQVADGARGEDVAALQAAIDQARAQREQTQAQYDAAQAALAEATFRLQQAQNGEGGATARKEDIVQAMAAVESSRLKLAQLQQPRAEDLRAAELEVAKAKSDLDAAENARDNCGQVSTTTTTKSTQKTDLGSTKSETKSTSKPGCSDAQEDELDAKVDSAKVALKLKQTALEKLKTPNAYEVQLAQQAVLQAQANVEKLRHGGTTDLVSLEMKVAQAQADVERIRGQLAQGDAGIVAAEAKLNAAAVPNPREIEQATAAAEQANANLARIANPDPYAVQSAAAAYDQTVAQFNSRQRPFTEEDIRIAAAGVDQAAAALAVAKVQAADALVVAPFGGVIAQKLLSAGALASPSSPILTLVARDVEIVAQVEEARLGRLRKGQAATLAAAAYPDALIPAEVSSISPTADAKSRSFTVRLVPVEQDGALRDGMFVQVRISEPSPEPVLQVPAAAVVTRGGRSFVYVVEGDRVAEREVRPGESDGRRTAILEGNLAQGDEVAVRGTDILIDGAAVVVEDRRGAAESSSASG